MDPQLSTASAACLGQVVANTPIDDHVLEDVRSASANGLCRKHEAKTIRSHIALDIRRHLAYAEGKYSQRTCFQSLFDICSDGVNDAIGICRLEEGSRQRLLNWNRRTRRTSLCVNTKHAVDVN